MNKKRALGRLGRAQALARVRLLEQNLRDLSPFNQEHTEGTTQLDVSMFQQHTTVTAYVIQKKLLKLFFHYNLAINI